MRPLLKPGVHIAVIDDDRVSRLSRTHRSMKIAVLSTRTGWHTDELQRAIVERGHTPLLLPYESLVARLGARAHAAPRLGTVEPDLFASDAVLPRTIPNPIEPKSGFTMTSPMSRNAAAASSARSHTTVCGVASPARSSSADV